MKHLRLRLARLTLALGVTSLIWACNAPFIPPPPPGQTANFTSALVPDGAGGQKMVWVASADAGQTTAFARVYVFDANRGAGVIARAMPDGSYASPPFDGTRGDRIEISDEAPGGTQSAHVCFPLIEGTQAPCALP